METGANAREITMTAYNVVRFKVKPGQSQKFIDGHKGLPVLKGMEDGALIKTGDNTFCLVGKWKNFDAIAAARPQMIGILDGFRGMLEDLGGGLGLTDPVSGNAVVDLKSK
jgi:hypothetical protein